MIKEGLCLLTRNHYLLAFWVLKIKESHQRLKRVGDFSGGLCCKMKTPVDLVHAR